LSGFLGIGTVVDVNLTDGGDATDRAAAVLRKAAIEARDDQVEVFGVHCGVEVYDVVVVTDPQADFDAEPRRVLGYSWRYEPDHGRYEMSLRLGNV
jgi:hypothetical protein